MNNLLSVIRREPGAMNHHLISVRKLREKAGMGKAAFDKAVMNLARSEKIFLHRHVNPYHADNIEQLVADGHGNFYMGIVLR